MQMPKSTQIGFYIVQIFCILFIIYWVQLIFYKSDTNKNIIVYSNYTTFYGIESGIEWKDVPSVTILCRIYSGSAMEFYNVFIVSYLLFWPYNSWRNSDIVAIMDDENEEDHRLGTILRNLPPFPKVYYEQYKENTFCSDWRSEGYSRQQYSNFYSDEYSNADYIAIIDSDAFFATKVTPEDLFIENKPRIYGYNGCCSGWTDSLNEALGVEVIGEFMVPIGFPILIKREHFKLVRDHMKTRMKTKNFEEAFHIICSKYAAKYSQFDLIIHYLWYFKRDEYAWFIKDVVQAKYKSLPNHITKNKHVLNKNKPIIGLMKYTSHAKYSTESFNLIYDYVCLASDMKAGDCKQYEREEVSKATKKNLFVNQIHQTAFWNVRKMPSNFRPIDELPWSVKDFSYEDAYNVHLKNIQERSKNNSAVWNWI